MRQSHFRVRATTTDESICPGRVGKLRPEEVPDLDQEHRLQERGWHKSGDPDSGDQCPDPLFGPCGVQVGFSASVRASPSGLEIMPVWQRRRLQLHRLGFPGAAQMVPTVVCAHVRNTDKQAGDFPQCQNLPINNFLGNPTWLDGLG